MQNSRKFHIKLGLEISLTIQSNILTRALILMFSFTVIDLLVSRFVYTLMVFLELNKGATVKSEEGSLSIEWQFCK